MINCLVCAVKGLIIRCLYLLGVFHIFRFVNRRKILVLTYHAVLPKSRINGRFSGKVVSQEAFERHIWFLKGHYNVISMDKLIKILYSGASFPEYACLITFDDGYKNNYKYAFPVLKRENVPAVVFLTTGYIGGDVLLWTDRVENAVINSPLKEFVFEGKKYTMGRTAASRVSVSNRIKAVLKNKTGKERDALIDSLAGKLNTAPADTGDYSLLNWDEVKEMSENNISFGSHTANHTVLTNETDEDILRELSESKKTIEEMLGYTPQALSYPEGRCNSKTELLAQKTGYKAAFSTKKTFIKSLFSPFRLSRIDPAGRETTSSLFALVSGTAGGCLWN